MYFFFFQKTPLVIKPGAVFRQIKEGGNVVKVDFDRRDLSSNGGVATSWEGIQDQGLTVQSCSDCVDCVTASGSPETNRLESRVLFP